METERCMNISMRLSFIVLGKSLMYILQLAYGVSTLRWHVYKAATSSRLQSAVEPWRVSVAAVSGRPASSTANCNTGSFILRKSTGLIVKTSVERR